MTNANDIMTTLIEFRKNERIAQEMYAVRSNIDEADRWLISATINIEDDELLQRCNELRDLLEKAEEISIGIAHGLKRNAFNQMRKIEALAESK